MSGAASSHLDKHLEAARPPRLQSQREGEGEGEERELARREEVGDERALRTAMVMLLIVEEEVV